MSMYKELDSLIADCCEVLSEDPPELRQKVVARYMTMFENAIFETTGTSIKRTVSPNDVDLTSIEMIMHLLQAHRDKLEYDMEMAKAKAAQVNASATATAEASVAATFNAAVDIVQGSSLTEKERDALEFAMARMRKAAEKKDRAGFAEKLREALDIIGKATDLAPSVVKAAGALASLF